MTASGTSSVAGAPWTLHADEDSTTSQGLLLPAGLALTPQLMDAPEMDAVVDRDSTAPLAARAAELGLPVFPISAVTGRGVPALLEAVWRHVQAIATTPHTPVEPQGDGASLTGGSPAMPPAMLTPDE